MTTELLEFTDPSDFSLFLLGRQTGPAESKREPDAKPTTSSRGGPSGPIGFVRDYE